jgi:hypothetical protein
MLKISRNQTKESMKLDGNDIKEVDTFTYLGSCINKNGKIQNEINERRRRPRGRPRTWWMDQVMRDVEKRGKKWTQVKQDREWEDRDRWRCLCNSRPKKLETT